MKINVGNTAQRPSSAVAGMVRFNSDSIGTGSALEVYNGTDWVHLGSSGGGSDGYVDNATFNTTTNYLTIEQTGAADVSVRIPPSYIVNPINADSLTRRVNDSTLMVKAVSVTSANTKISVSSTRTDSTVIHQLTVNEANFTGIPQSAVTGLTDSIAAKAGTTNVMTMSNKRWVARVGSTTSSATPTINTDNYDIYKLTAQTADITSFTTNLTGTPNDGEILEIQITGTAARAITWGASFVASTVALPTTTVTTATLTVIFQYYTTSSYGNNKWVCVNSY